MKKPANWIGWPKGKKFALVLTHDIETRLGQERCPGLMHLEMNYQLISSYNFLCKSYPDDLLLRQELRHNGFEIGVHGIRHNARLYASEKRFRKNALQINKYLKEWNAVGFRSPSMFHNLQWIHYLDIQYDASTFDTDPLEPQPDPLPSIFPVWIPHQDPAKGYVELPYTLPQDFTLFVLLKEKSIDIWKRKLDWIAENGGMALVITHPDYMCFSGKNPACNEYPIEYYEDFLEYVRSNYRNEYWNVLPKDIAEFWRGATKME
jgi:peptidoglycan/xylan/chitin deacetylase (PgdA/CDA1 family)